MHKLLLIAAAIGVSTAPAAAQTAPAQPQTEPSHNAAQQQAKPTKKIVCRDVDEERGIGSRLARTTKVCKEVEVHAPANAQQQSPQSNRDAR